MCTEMRLTLVYAQSGCMKYDPDTGLVPQKHKHKMCVCVCVFGFNVVFNKFSVMVAAGSSVLTFIMLPHYSIMSQTLDMIPHPVTLS